MHLNSNNPQEHLQVQTTSGIVAGTIDPQTGVRTWRGVPYGADMGGENRFRAPQPAPSWSGVRTTTNYRPPAMQTNFGWKDTVIGTEDCLHADIVRPDTDDVLPVVIYFHGGSFVSGSSHEKVLQGHFLANATDIVYVSLNFRLGVLGYLDLRSIGEDCAANPAILDQILALQWVHENIAAFGGDPNNVTIMGESAGAASVIHMMCAPAARGLFHRAIAQSTPLSSVHTKAQAAMWTSTLLDGMGLSRLSTLEHLREVPAEELVRVGQSMLFTGRELRELNLSFMPTVDGTTLPAHPLDMFRAGQQASVPLIIGTNADEASFAKALYQRTKARQRAARRLLEAYDAKNATAVIQAYSDVSQRTDFAEFLADAVFWGPSVIAAGEHRKVAPTWMYRFEYASATMRRLGLGAMHTADLMAVFGDREGTRSSKIDRFGSTVAFEAVVEVMQRNWGSFFHTGEPGPNWPRYDFRGDDHPGRATAIINEHPSIVYDPKRHKRRAWEAFDMRSWQGREAWMRIMGSEQ
ncbi:carboxylesterase/lipase family protein [Corynebacterium sp. CCUG 61414]|uniref:carboxylesterase/lipase family protein n=1 Tax=Corynebacterium TaxID=1716 RepID=UPI00210CC53D|nr:MULTISPECIES: carboxylesterase/lipase family protein [Corynebacterium]MCQ4609428.1 carboxylesterase/lipase family protein [Corynebacterium sp. CCUG 61414]MCQ4616500.1 carboxylesterase/lipase family protein [Corynebacterium pseudogenitalium]